ncbi:MAG TPA: hypothetical protein ENJ35_03660 [Gammaproteobacteria bacterium]|nr:hypothetical protein [Gammaproteobacteria bacterium]
MQTQALQIHHDGLDRKYQLMIPDDPDGTLLIGLHGATQRGSIMARTTSFHELPDASHFTLAYPDAWEGTWRDGRAEDDDVDDVGFIEKLIVQLVDYRNIDRGRIVLVGASNGGFLSQRLICELPGQFRAVATVIATMGLAVFQRSYIDEIPSLFLVAGTADPIIPYNGGETPGSLMNNENAPIIGFEDLVEHWKNLGSFDRCEHYRRQVPALDSGELLIDTESCSSSSHSHRMMRAITVEGGGHQWYGRRVSQETLRHFGASTTEFQLSAEIIRFFGKVLQ